MDFARVYSPFAAGYLLSYMFRVVNAIISPELSRDLALSPGALGLLTSAYFIAFGAVQIPAGMLLDRFGPRRIEPVFLLIGGTGALVFALASSEGMLLAGRALIGLGVATCLMAPLKGIATWYPHDRQASLSGWMMVAGGLGALLASAPLEFALRFVAWRTVFVFLAMATFGVAAWIWWCVPDVATSAQTPGWRVQWAGVRQVFRNPRFWWLAPLGSLAIGAFMAIQGLWSVPWMMEVQGMDRAGAARHLLVMSMVTLSGYFFLGGFATRLARRGIQPAHLFGGGFGVNILALALITTDIPGRYLWWGLYGLGASVNVLGFTVLAQGVARELTGRANTALNLLMFVGSFAAQWGIGAVVDASRRWWAFDTAAGLRLGFGLALGIEALAYAWFLFGWRRHAAHPDAAAARA